MIHVIHDRSYTVVTFTLTRISRKSSLVRENSFHRTIDFSKIESLYILKKKIDKRPAENVCWWLARRVDSSMVEYGKDNINSFLIEEQPLEEPEPACFNISPYELLGKGETRAKIIVRLKLEEIVSFSKLSSCRYVNRMSSDQTRLDWLGYLSTNEIAASCLVSDNHALEVLKIFKYSEVVKDKILVFRNVKVSRRGTYPFSTRVHMWKIHNPFPDRLYQLARLKLHWDDPAELFKRFKDRVKNKTHFVVTKK